MVAAVAEVVVPDTSAPASSPLPHAPDKAALESSSPPPPSIQAGLPSSQDDDRVLICVGDLHGQYDNLLKLWKNLEIHLGPEIFARAKVIFLGDYNDRGPDTKKVIEWLTHVSELHPQQKHSFIIGNHDFSFMAFLGILPSPPEGFSFKTTWENELLDTFERPGWWANDGEEDDMHLQGLRWGGRMGDSEDSTYSSASTFASYGVAHGDRAGLIAAVPEHHKEFLRNCDWVCEETVAGKRVIAVHAGFDAESPAEEQIAVLRRKDSTVTRYNQFSARKEVLPLPEEYQGTDTIVVSGHHGFIKLEEPNRIIMDESGGHTHMPLSAIILPSWRVIRHIDDESELSRGTLAAAEEKLEPVNA